MDEKVKEMQELLSSLGVKQKKVLKGSAKYITLAVLVLVLAFGIFGSFKGSGFDMASYVTFLESFAWFFVPLIASIGAGSVTSMIKENKEVKNENT